MTIFYRQSTYRVPGTYQWVKPSIAAGSGPFGSTYQQTIITVIGPGSGGASGSSGNNVGNGFNGGNGGNPGPYANATYLPASLNALEDIVVGAGTLGGLPQSIAGTNNGGGFGGASSLTATPGSKFGAHISCPGGQSSGTLNPQFATVVGGSNVVKWDSLSGIAAVTLALVQPSSSPNTLLGIQHNIPTWSPVGNNGGAPGGCAINSAPPFLGGDGGGVLIGGGGGRTNANGVNAGVPGAGGGGCTAAVLGIILNGGNGADAKQNSGAGGGGGGAATSTILAGAGAFITGGQGGRGSDGVVQVTDIFSLTPQIINPYYIQFDLTVWYHMMNQARPISLTGRYKS